MTFGRSLNEEEVSHIQARERAFQAEGTVSVKPWDRDSVTSVEEQLGDEGLEQSEW